MRCLFEALEVWSNTSSKTVTLSFLNMFFGGLEATKLTSNWWEPVKSKTELGFLAKYSNYMSFKTDIGINIAIIEGFPRLNAAIESQRKVNKRRDVQYFNQS